MSHHVVSIKAYVAVFLALMVLTALTVYVANINFGFLNDVVAMSIAVVKMMLVIMIFMHLKYSARLLWLVAGSGFLWLLIMFALTLSDYRSREWIESQVTRPDMWVASEAATRAVEIHAATEAVKAPGHHGAEKDQGHGGGHDDHGDAGH